MLVDKIRKRMKGIIWFIVISFVISVFFIGAAGWLESLAAQDRQKKQAEERANRVFVDPEYDVTSKKELASIGMHGKSVSVTEGDRNRRILDLDLNSKLKGLPDFYKTGLYEQILTRLIDEKLLVLEAAAKNVNVEEKIQQQISQFKNNPKANFNAIIKANGFQTEEQYVDYMRHQFLVNEMNTKLFEGVTVKDEDIEFYYNLNKDKYKDADGNVKKLEDVKSVIYVLLRDKVSPEQVQAYYNEHKSRWMLPKTMDLSYIMVEKSNEVRKKAVQADIKDAELQSYYDANKSEFLSADIAEIAHIYLSKETLRSELSISDEEAQTYYDENKSDFATEEEVKASHILVKADNDEEAKAQATKIREDILAEKITFEDAAKEFSTDKGNKDIGGDLGYFAHGAMVSEFEEAAFNAEVGSITEPVKTTFGYHIIKVTDHKKAGVSTLAEARSDIDSLLLDSKVTESSDKKIAEIEKALTEGKDFSELAKTYSHAKSAEKGGVLGRIFLGEGNDKSTIAEIADAGRIHYPVLSMLKTLEIDQVSDMVETPSGYYKLKLLKKHAPEIQAFEKVKTIVSSKILAQKLEKLYLDKVAKLKAELNSDNFELMVTKYSDSASAAEGGKLTNIVFDDEVSTAGVNVLYRTELGYGDKLHAKLVNAVQYLKANQVSSIVDLGDKSIVMKVTRLNDLDYKPFDKVSKEIEKAITLSVDSIDIKEYYDKNKKQFATEDKVVLQTILYKNIEDASLHLAQINKNEITFDQAGNSLLNQMRANFQIDEGKVNLGDVSYFDEATQKEIQALKVNELYSKPINAGVAGYFLVKMVENSKGSVPSLESISEQIRETLQKEKRTEVLEQYAKELRNQADKIQIF
ncbi:MAG: peptidyl-prolyl cis-trans isomerase [Candidatus Cloacimonetes bacterium]|nr:peptidyl-prolyl cis-trans isomerase [Candidatus Cloacimonadota bacterium]